MTITFPLKTRIMLASTPLTQIVNETIENITVTHHAGVSVNNFRCKYIYNQASTVKQRPSKTKATEIRGKKRVCFV